MYTYVLRVEVIPVHTTGRLKAFKNHNVWNYINVILDVVRVYYPIDMMKDSGDECPPT